MSDRTSAPILCFGEVLWDCLPDGLFLGGAPINVAYHLRRLGFEAIPVTGIGNDFLGNEILRRLREWNIDIGCVHQHPAKPTGAVIVTLDAGGHPSYRFLDNVAWDEIEFAPAVMNFASSSAALIYGSLAQRSAYNRQQLARLLGRCREAIKVFDVNLRPPFDSPDVIWQLAEEADLIKVNDDELQRLLGTSIPFQELESAARFLGEKTACSRICVTAGSRGAGLLDEGAWFWSLAAPIEVSDTVGAGDAFLAALVGGLIRGVDPQPTLSRACRLAGFVASRRGATPAYSVSATGEIAATG